MTAEVREYPVYDLPVPPLKEGVSVDGNIQYNLLCASFSQLGMEPDYALSVIGSLIGDLWEQNAFLKDCEAYGQQVIAATQGITVVFGNVAIDWKRKNKDGHVRKYNAAFTAQNGKLITTEQGLDYVAKTSLPAYRLFDDPRYFSGQETLLKDKRVSLKNGMGSVAITLRGQDYKLGLFLCEDGWTENYPVNVPDLLKQGGAEILCNLSSSPFTLGKNSKRHIMFGKQAKELQLPVVYCNHTGIQKIRIPKRFEPTRQKMS